MLFIQIRIAVVMLRHPKLCTSHLLRTFLSGAVIISTTRIITIAPLSNRPVLLPFNHNNIKIMTSLSLYIIIYIGLISSITIQNNKM